MGRKMKDSGVEWIGEIPEDWKIVSLKRLCSFEAGKTLSSNEIAPKGAYKVYGGNGLRGYYSQYNHEGDCLLVGRQGALCGNVHEVSGKFWATEHAWITTKTPVVDAGYLFELLKGMNLNQYASNAAAQPGLSVGVVANVKTVLPPKNEQEKIANKLHNKCVVIENLIEKNKEIIETYKSLKQSLITRAVTKGVRGKREMKDSRVKRWGMIPNNWDFVRLKYCITNVSSGLSAVTDDDTSGESGKFVLRTSAVSTGIFIPSEVKAVLKSAEVRLKCPVEGNTLIVSRMNTSNMVGSCAYVDRDYENIFLPDKLWKIHLKKEYNVKFFWYAINSIPARAYYSEISTGASASMQNITMADFGNNKIALPPIDEQDCIASYLDEKCTAIDTLIAKKEQLLTELEAYKKSLIYEYVTGKR